MVFKASRKFEPPSSSRLCDALHHAAEQYRFTEDPYILELEKHSDEWSRKQLAKVRAEGKTTCSDHIRVLSRRAITLYEQLGPPVAEWYIHSYIKRFRDNTHGDMVLPDVTFKEQQHLTRLLTGIAGAATRKAGPSEVQAISDKAERLISLLEQRASPSLRGIIFVEQRATVSALIHLLRSTPRIASQYSIGAFMGTSSFASRNSSIADLAEAKEQQRDLEDFRGGSKNLMVATNVLEEGIDVSACNLVACFDLPPTLVSFVQRRGRARQKGSTYYLFVSEDDWKTDAMKWQRQEAEMKQAYMSDVRDNESAISEDEDALGTRIYRISSTSALLTLENAKAHLYHFCAVSTLQVSNYVDPRPEFSPQKASGDKPWTATVTLPSFVHPDLRTASSSTAWRTEDAAFKDAAFEAYVALHRAGLVNDNLLPLVKDGPAAGLERVDQASIIPVCERQSSWTRLLAARVSGQWYAHTVTVRLGSEIVVAMEMCIPALVNSVGAITLYWNERTTYTVTCEPVSRAAVELNAEELRSLQRYTGVLLLPCTRVGSQQTGMTLQSSAARYRPLARRHGSMI